MTKQPKTPTLAQLRKLAKRKYGSEARLVLKPWANRGEITSGCVWVPRGVGSGWVLDFNGSNAEVRAGLFAALSALPDAKGGQR